MNAARLTCKTSFQSRSRGETVYTSPGRTFFARLVEETLSEDGGEVPASLIRYDTAYEKNALRDLVVDSFKLLGIERTAKLLDALKDEGFRPLYYLGYHYRY